MKKYLCRVSHEEARPGGFTAFVSGEVYEFDSAPCPLYFRPQAETAAAAKEIRKEVKTDGE